MNKMAANPLMITTGGDWVFADPRTCRREETPMLTVNAYAATGTRTCGRPASEAGQLVAGPGVWICASCVSLAVDVI